MSQIKRASKKALVFFAAFLFLVNLAHAKVAARENARELAFGYSLFSGEFYNLKDATIKNYYSNEYVPIKIANSGIKRAYYYIILDAPDWISIEPKNISINPQQFGNLNLHINPDAQAAAGAYAIKISLKSGDVVYSRNIVIVLSKRQFLKGLKLFFVFYKYYIYAVLLIAAALFAFRRKISGKIKAKYKNYKIRRARLRALKAARKARQLKIQIKKLEKAQLEAKKISNPKRKRVLFFITSIGVASILFFSIYRFDFPVSKEFIKTYYAYFIAGILIALFIIFMIEFYKPLFRMLKK